MATFVGMCFDPSFPPVAVAEFATRLEGGGVDELWLIEDCFATTAPPMAAAALSSTERLTVGLGILPAVARTAAVTAMEIATLAGFGPGRVVGGIGHGVQHWMAQMGVRPSSPVTALDEVLTAVRRLLAGETVSVRGSYVTLDEVALAHVPDPVPPVVAGVRGPRSLALAGRSADGVLLDSFSSPEMLRRARGLVGRDPADFEYRTFATMCVTPTREEAYGICAGLLAEQLDRRHPPIMQAPFADALLEIYAKDGVDGLARMPSDLWGRLGAIGTVDDAAGYVNVMAEAGARSVALYPAPDLTIARGQIEDVIAIRSALG